jgi:hypothetical protein
MKKYERGEADHIIASICNRRRNSDLRADDREVLSALNERLRELREALEPFARMHREDCDLSELACQRGIASDMTIITSRDFARAFEALRPVTPTMGTPRSRRPSDVVGTLGSGENYTVDLSELSHLRRQRDQLQAANTAEVERRREAEARAERLHEVTRMSVDAMLRVTEKFTDACATLNALTVVISRAIETSGVQITPTELPTRLANLLTVLICERDLAREANGNLEARAIAAEQRAGEMESIVRRLEETVRSAVGEVDALLGSKPDPICEECGHEVSLHEPKYGCEVERGDGYVGDVLQAMGPCGCKAVTKGE